MRTPTPEPTDADRLIELTKTVALLWSWLKAERVPGGITPGYAQTIEDNCISRVQTKMKELGLATGETR